MAGRNIKTIVGAFKKSTDEERYRMLQVLLEGDAETAKELDWRARLVTALRVARVYPMESYNDYSSF